MSPEHEQLSHLKTLDAILDEYTEWFLAVMRRLFYPGSDTKSKGQGLVRPDSFGAWLATNPDNINNLVKLHSDLIDRAELLVTNAQKAKLPPTQDDFRKLTILFEEFTRHIRRFEKDNQASGDIDHLTGLRSSTVMEKDIRREIDRLARQGKTFSIALVRIDNFDAMQKNLSTTEIDDCIKAVAEMVKRSIRSFDDAYRLDGNLFVLSLKQTETDGGVRALRRLRMELDNSSIVHNLDGQQVPLSLSSCVGEPNEKSNVISFIDHLKSDLDVYRDKSGAIVEHFELSPLQRYIRDQDQERS